MYNKRTQGTDGYVLCWCAAGAMGAAGMIGAAAAVGAAGTMGAADAVGGAAADACEGRVDGTFMCCVGYIAKHEQT